LGRPENLLDLDRFAGLPIFWARAQAIEISKKNFAGPANA
jgi:hypothetical protein